MMNCENQNTIITIDGPAGTGKSTVARRLADSLGYQLLNTGAMYRGVAWKCLQENANLNDPLTACELAKQLNFDIDQHQMLIDGENLENSLHSPRVSQAASVIAAYPGVREVLVQRQRELGEQYSLVSEGRDQGTIVFPETPCKFFLTASVEIRARRRFEELQGSGEITFEDVLKDQEERDRRDATREVAPLKPADDAEIIDSTEMSIEDVVRVMQNRVQQLTALNK